MPRRDLAQRGRLGAAAVGRVAAARVEITTGGRVDRVWHLAFEHDALAAMAQDEERLYEIHRAAMRERVRQSGVRLYLRKPLHKRVLLGAIRRALALASGRADEEP